jgi:hypothetical protein
VFFEDPDVQLHIYLWMSCFSKYAWYKCLHISEHSQYGVLHTRFKHLQFVPTYLPSPTLHLFFAFYSWLDLFVSDQTKMTDREQLYVKLKAKPVLISRHSNLTRCKKSKWFATGLYRACCTTVRVRDFWVFSSIKEDSCLTLQYSRASQEALCHLIFPPTRLFIDIKQM